MKRCLGSFCAAPRFGSVLLLSLGAAALACGSGEGTGSGGKGSTSTGGERNEAGASAGGSSDGGTGGAQGASGGSGGRSTGGSGGRNSGGSGGKNSGGSGGSSDVCAEGTFDDDGNADTACRDWKECKKGTYVAVLPSATEDRQCAPCEEGTFTDKSNQEQCAAHPPCAAGTYERSEGTPESAPVCEDCAEGYYCPGGSAEPSACSETTWDHDGSAASPCMPRATCAAGYKVLDDGSATTNRTCEECVSGYTTDPNLTECEPWTECPEGYVEDAPGTSTSDRTCKSTEWLLQYGTTGTDYARDMFVDAEGSVYVAGDTAGTLPDQEKVGGTDLYVRKFDATGAVIWTRQFGTTGADHASAITVDAGGNVYVTGYTYGAFGTATNAGSIDAYVVKLSPNGETVLWTAQIGTTGQDQAVSVVVSPAGDVYVSGFVEGTLPGSTSSGLSDLFLRKFDGNGNVTWTRQFGSDGHDQFARTTLDANGDLYVAGTVRGNIAGLTSLGNADVLVRKLAPNGDTLWTTRLGTNQNDYANAISVSAALDVYVAGSTEGAFPGFSNLGQTDAFVTKLGPTGTVAWSSQLGTSQNDSAAEIISSSETGVVIAGRVGGALPGHVYTGNSLNVFLAGYDALGEQTFTWQRGRPVTSSAVRVAADGEGGYFICGSTSQAFPGFTSFGEDDAFLMHIVPD